MAQRLLPSSVLRNGHTFGSLQQAPHWTHRPVRVGETGNTDVKVRLSLAPQVFFELPAISSPQ